MPYIEEEIATQPDRWRQAAALHSAGTVVGLPEPGERVAVIGCGTSRFMAQTYARLREESGHGESDAFQASEFPLARRYDRVLAITRTGTTTEVVRALAEIGGRTPTTVITAEPTSDVIGLAKDAVILDFANERSIVQTRFATSTLALLRAHLGQDVEALAAAAEVALTEPLPANALDARQYTFLGTGWTVGLANEAALKLRESTQSWSESYPGMEYRHGPNCAADERTLAWIFGPPADNLVADVRATGATVEIGGHDAMVELVRVQLLAVELAAAKGLDVDNPRNLTRSVILP
ncbi:SIS domain-containing protein [Actinophytocola sediminis]